MNKYIFYSDKLVLPVNIQTCKITVSKHFRNTWMRKWNWDFHDLRDAIDSASTIEKIGKKGKYEIYTSYDGPKKLIISCQFENEIIIFTGTEHSSP